MTIIAFDGKHLVADGASTHINKKYKKSSDSFHLTKIVVPNFNWYDKNSNITIKALVGTGVTSDIRDVIDELMVAGRLELCARDHFTRIQKLLRERVSCHVMAVGFEHFGPTTEPHVTDIFQSLDLVDRDFRWHYSDPAAPAIAGYIDHMPDWKLGDGWNNALEIVSFGNAMFPDKCGGLISRFNIHTGKLDHPKLTRSSRINSMLKKYEQEEIAKIKERVNKGRDFLINPINTY
ncbi:hypothetical protein [Aeromonas phage AerS_266]|nr:hypothetical protein [Aeromonas phage AerS_266]